MSWCSPYFCPTKRCATSSSIRSLKRWHAYSCMITVVIRKFCQVQVALLATSQFQHTSSKYVLERMNYPLRLTIGLRGYIVLNLTLVSKVFWNVFQNIEVNIEYLLEMILTSTSCNFTILSTYFLAKHSTVSFLLTARKWADLFGRSTVT